MKTLLARSVALALLMVAGMAGCDPGSSNGSTMQSNDDGNDPEESDDGEHPSGSDVWTHELGIGNFTYSETLVDVWGDCTTTRTFEGEVNDDCSSGSILVGVPAENGNLVSAGLTLCGRLTISDETTPASCDSGGSSTLDKTAVAVLTLLAPTVDDPMQLFAPRNDSSELDLSTMVFAASALEEEGTTKTLVLDASVDAADQSWGTVHREVHVEVDIEVLH